MKFSEWLRKVEVSGPTDGHMLTNDKRYAARGAGSKNFGPGQDDETASNSDNFDPDAKYGLMKKKMKKKMNKGTK
tara:strand:+ start:3876 stop:4100 length:225 start_codon:yes stop_codon:yes gene_type:complete